MGFFKTLLSLAGWIFACMGIFIIPSVHKFSSRIAVALLPAGILANTITLIPFSHFLNVCLWIVLVLAAVILLTQMPRSKCAGVYMVSFLPMYAICRIAVDKIFPLLFQNFQKTAWTTVILWIISLVMAFCMMIGLRKEIQIQELKRYGFKILDRVVASLICSTALLMPMLLYSDRLLLFFLAVLGLGVVMYFLDMLLFNWYLTTDFDPPPTQEEIERAQRRADRRERRRNSIPAKIVRGTVSGVLRGTMSVARLGFGIVTGVLNLAGMDVQNPIPQVDFQNRQNEELMEYIREGQEHEQAEYDRIQKETESAIRYYEENYQ